MLQGQGLLGSLPLVVIVHRLQRLGDGQRLLDGAVRGCQGLGFLQPDLAQAQVAQAPCRAKVEDAAQPLPDLAAIGLAGAGIGAPDQGRRRGHTEQPSRAWAAWLEQVEGIKHVVVSHDRVVLTDNGAINNVANFA